MPQPSLLLAINELLKAYAPLTCLLADDAWLHRMDIESGQSKSRKT